MLCKSSVMAIAEWYRSRINGDKFLKWAPKAQASRGVLGHAPSRKCKVCTLVFWVILKKINCVKWWKLAQICSWGSYGLTGHIAERITLILKLKLTYSMNRQIIQWISVDFVSNLSSACRNWNYGGWYMDYGVQEWLPKLAGQWHIRHCSWSHDCSRSCCHHCWHSGMCRSGKGKSIFLNLSKYTLLVWHIILYLLCLTLISNYDSLFSLFVDMLFVIWA